MTAFNMFVMASQKTAAIWKHLMRFESSVLEIIRAMKSQQQNLGNNFEPRTIKYCMNTPCLRIEFRLIKFIKSDVFCHNWIIYTHPSQCWKIERKNDGRHKREGTTTHKKCLLLHKMINLHIWKKSKTERKKVVAIACHCCRKKRVKRLPLKSLNLILIKFFSHARCAAKESSAAYTLVLLHCSKYLFNHISACHSCKKLFVVAVAVLFFV